MKIPRRKVLVAGVVLGSALTAVSSYWIGKRDQVDQFIDAALSGSSKNLYHDGKYVCTIDFEPAPEEDKNNADT